MLKYSHEMVYFYTVYLIITLKIMFTWYELIVTQ